MGKLIERRRDEGESLGLFQVYFTLMNCLLICLNLIDSFYYYSLSAAAATSLADSEGDCRL